MAYDNDALMAAAAQMLSMSGPSRQPVGLGQILGGGIGAYKSAELAAKQRKLEEDQARQMAEVRALQMQKLQGEVLDDEKARTTPKLPKYSTAVQVGRGADGKAFSYVLAEDGSMKVLDGVLPRDKMEVQDLGGSKVAYDPYAVTPGQSFAKTLTPEGRASEASAAASRAQAERHFNINQAKEAKPVFNAELGGFVSPPTKANPNGGIIPLAGAPSKGPKMTEDQAKATGWLVQAETAWNNMKAVAYDEKGKITGAAKPGFPDFVAGIPSFGIGEAAAQTMRGKDRQKFIQAASSAGEALLRAATGAGVNRDEAIQKVRELTPQFGDDDELIAQKMAAMPVYLETLKVRAGPGAKLAADVIPKPAGNKGWGIKKVD